MNAESGPLTPEIGLHPTVNCPYGFDFGQLRIDFIANQKLLNQGEDKQLG